MEVGIDIYNWLKDCSLITDEIEVSENGKYQIPEEKALLFENGLNFTPLLKRLNKVQNKLDRETTPMPEINSLKEVKSAASKLYNWKILTSALELLGIKIDPDSRSLIIAGDRDMLVEILMQIHEAEIEASQQFDDQEFEKESNKSKILYETVEKTLKKKKETSQPKKNESFAKTGKTKKKPDGSLYIESIKADKSLESTDSCLEFLLVSFCKHFSLRPKQAAGLLTQGGKYLAYVIAKGLKGKHGPIVLWYQEIYAYVSHLLKLICLEEANGSVPLMLASLKSGFNSKSLETVLWCCRIFSKLGSELLEQDLLPSAWDWFVSENGGLESCLQACKRFGPEVKSQIVSVLVQFARNNFYELFSIQMRNYLPDNVHYLTTMNEFLQNFWEIRAAKQEIISVGIIEYWIEMSIREADNENQSSVDIRLSSINFCCDIWILFPAVMENHEIYANDILNSLKKGWRDKFKILKFGCIAKAFQLLEVFTTERNSFAPIIYKSLTFYLVENYTDEIVREFILHNFNVLFDTHQTIPVGILLEPLVKQIQVASNLKFNTIDFDFFIRVARHSKLTMKYAVQTMDALGKIYMNERHFSKSAGIPFMAIASRFIEGSSVREYLYRFLKYSLKLTYKYETKVFDKSFNPTNETDTKLKFQRDIMLDLSQKIIKLRNDYLTDRIIKELCDSNTLIKKRTGNNSKAVILLLKLLGDPRELLDTYASQPENIEKNTSGDDEVALKDIHRRDVKKEKFGSESSTTSLNSMNLMPRGRIDRHLERIRQDLIEKELESKLKEEKSKISLENRKRILRKQVEQRRIELGVFSKSELERKNDDARTDNQVIKEFTSEEKETINFVLKRYQRVLKLLFKKYSSTGYKHSIVSKETFESLAEKNSTLSDSEFYRLLKEQGVTTSMVTIEEFSQIMKNYCHQRKKPQLKVSFLEFSELLTQTAVFIYSKAPNDYSHLPPAVSLKFLFEYFRKLSNGKGISRKFYDEPDPGVGDREVVKRLNLLLEKDPETPIPEGFKKVVETDIELVYQVPSTLGISESQSVGISILDGILEKCLGIHILEPLILVKSITRARGVLSKPQIAGESETGSVIGSKFNLSQMGITYHKAVYQPALPTDLNLTAGIKFEIARLTGKVSNELLYESAQLLDDLIYTVDSGSNVLISRNAKQKIMNKAQILKEQNLKTKLIEEEKKEQKRKLRSQVIEKKLEKASMNKKNKIKEEADKKKAEEARKKEIAKKNEEKKIEENQKKSNEVKEWKEKKKQENFIMREEENKKKALADEQKKKKLEQFKENEKKRLQKIESEKNEKNISEKKTNDDQNKKKDQAKQDKKKFLEKVLLPDKIRKEENQKTEENIRNLKQNPKIQEIFKSLQKSLELIYNHYCKLTAGKEGASNNFLILSGFNKFCAQFSISPGILSIDDCLKVFRTLTKSKPIQESGMISLNFEDFKEACLRLSQLTKANLVGPEDEKLKSFFEYLKVNSDPKQMRELVKNIEISAPHREKKRIKNQNNQSLSREITPVSSGIRSKSTTKKKTDNETHA